MSTLTEPTSEALTKLALTLENDLDAGGWDQPHSLYVVAGTLEDPYLVRLIDLPLDGSHPCDLLQELYDGGHRLRPEALGLAFANEGWRHLNLQELEQIDDRLIRTMREAGRLLLPEADQDEIDKTISKQLFKVQSALRPSQMPEHLRKEVRMITIVLRDGTRVGANRSRGEDEAHVIGVDNDLGGRVSDFMYQFIKGERPHDVPRDSEEESNDLPPAGSVD